MDTDCASPKITNISVDINNTSRSVTPDSASLNSNYNDLHWYYIPDSILLSIFQYLTPKEIVNVGLVCTSWNRISKDELLWKKLFYKTYKIEPNVGIMPGMYFSFFP